MPRRCPNVVGYRNPFGAVCALLQIASVSDLHNQICKPETVIEARGECADPRTNGVRDACRQLLLKVKEGDKP